MNIFVLSEDPKWAARYHCNKHVIKMITETCQLLSNAVRWHVEKTTFSESYKRIIYEETHPHHPCTLWVKDKWDNFMWLNNLLGYLIAEYDYRFEKPHKFTKARKLHKLFTKIIADVAPLADGRPHHFVICMPDDDPDLEELQHDPVKAYRMYYVKYKSHILKYTKRQEPPWMHKSPYSQKRSQN